MKLKKNILIGLSVLSSLICAPVYAASELVTISGYESSEHVQTVYGVWSANTRVNFNQSQNYTLSLKDFNFGSGFDNLGIMISTSTEQIAALQFGSGQDYGRVSFDIASGDYWLSVFAISDSDINVGTFGFDISLTSDLANVPLPPAIAFFVTALAGLGFTKRFGKHRSESLEHSMA